MLEAGARTSRRSEPQTPVVAEVTVAPGGSAAPETSSRMPSTTNCGPEPMLLALTDLSAYKAAHNLTDADVLEFGDLNHDGSITNADIQALEDLLG